MTFNSSFIFCIAFAVILMLGGAFQCRVAGYNFEHERSRFMIHGVLAALQGVMSIAMLYVACVLI